MRTHTQREREREKRGKWRRKRSGGVLVDELGGRRGVGRGLAAPPCRQELTFWIFFAAAAITSPYAMLFSVPRNFSPSRVLSCPPKFILRSLSAQAEACPVSLGVGLGPRTLVAIGVLSPAGLVTDELLRCARPVQKKKMKKRKRKKIRFCAKVGPIVFPVFHKRCGGEFL